MSMWIPATAVSVALLAAHAAGAERRTIGKIDKRDPRLDQLVAADATIEVLADGFKWSEGPIWDRSAKRLLFSDVPNNVVHAWSEAAGLSVFLKPSGYTGTEPYGGREPGSNGLTFDAKGRLVLCQHGDKRVARREGDAFVTLADKFEGKRFNSPNDLVYAKDGSLYFTDPPYGLAKQDEDPAKRWRSTASIGSPTAACRRSCAISIGPTAWRSRPISRSSTSTTPTRRRTS